MQQRSFRRRGVRLGFEEHGQGDEVVVLMHGLLLDAGINRAVAGFRCGREGVLRRNRTAKASLAHEVGDPLPRRTARARPRC